MRVQSGVMRRRGLAALAVLGAATLAVAGCSDSGPLTTPDGKTVSTSTTRIAEVNVVSPERDFSRTCLAPTAPEDPARDAARIVVTDPALLDALCALGVGPKVTAVTSAPGSIPAYLGPQLTSVPTVGTRPDAATAKTASPDLVLTTPRTAASAQAFSGVRSVGVDDGGWEQRFRTVADALGRSASAQRLLDELHTEATKTGTKMDAAHSQVSLVRMHADGESIAGTDSFAGQVLTMIGVQRPAPQRGPDGYRLDDDNFRTADGDLIYVSFDGKGGLEHGRKVLLSDRWLDLGAPTWKRVLNVDDDVWYRTSGVAAAWLVLNDVKESLNSSSIASG